PTVPSQVITDGSGGFTCIVSVLNQTDGTYTIRAVDGAENEESATFTVTTAAQSKTTVIVPVDYPTIQEAINHAQEGDTIVVKDGTYYENVTVNKSLTIESQNGAENTIVCTLEPETGKHVFRIEADNVVIKGFTLSGITGWSNHGIYLREVENCVISDNICVNNSAGINLYNSHSNLIENNNLSNNQDGLYMHQSHNNSIIGNVASKSTAGTGICLGFSSYNKIVNNTANENRGAGIELMEHGTSNNLIAGNIFSSNRLKGIQLFAADNNRIVNNTILNNSKGIFLRGGSKNNVVASNTILGNSVGIFVGDPSNEYGNCNGSRIYLNVLDNSYNVFSYESSNFWNSTEKIAYTHENGDFIGYLGNYWSNYNGTDTNGDGVGDVPYFIDDDNQDDYPLMVPNSATPSFSYILTVDSLPSGVTFTADGTAFTTPWSETYNENTAVSLTMPEFYFYNGEKYTWIQWTDGKSDRQRTVTLNEDTSLIAVFAPEDTPLQISVLSPTNKTYSTVDIPLEISVNRFFYSTTYSLDGQVNTTVVGNTTLLGMSQGTHSIVIYIEDSPGSISALETVYFTVASANGFSILSPENRTYNTTDIPVTYTKNETCYYLGYSLDGQLYTDKENVTLTALSEGAHQLMFYANYSGRVTGEFATVWFTVDTTPPNITEVTQAPADTNETTEGVMVNATVTDTVSDVKRVTLSYSDGNGTWVNVEMAKLEGNIWNGMIPPFPHGTTITYTVIAEDNAGNIVTTEELYEQPNQYETLPEFQSWILLPLSLIITSFVVVIKKKTKLIGFNKILQTLPRKLKIRQ
ncbi:MAG: hypothetical protein CW716_05285, partial [Candidatus Bathyarchaeum sp.]